MPPQILLPASSNATTAPVQITVTPVPQEQDEDGRSLEPDLYALELLAYQSIKARNITGFNTALDSGMDSTHVFSTIPFDDVQNDTLLQFVVKENFVPAVEKLIFHHRRKNLSAAVMTAFTYAMRNDLIDIVRLFLSGIIHNRIHMRLSDAFRHAVYKSQYDLVEEIIKKPGFDVNMETTWGMDRPLHIVAQRPNLVTLLLEKGAIVNVADRKGAAPLIPACTLSKVHSVYALLQHGADPNHTSCRELLAFYSALHTVYRFAYKKQHAQEIVNLLLMAGLTLRKESLWLNTATPNEHFPEEMLQQLRHISQNALSLKLQCSIVIKQCLLSYTGGRSILKYIYCLPIPTVLQKQLALAHYCLTTTSTNVFT